MDNPEALGLDPDRWQRVERLLAEWCEQDRVPAAAVVVGRSDRCSEARLFGRHGLTESPPIRDDAIFLVASITKPVVATGVLLLVERAQLALDDRVTEYLPEFGSQGKYAVTVRHLLTHTSGLPDMLPNNIELRADSAPLDAFVEGTCAIKPDFPAGRGVQYQSMGFAILGELIRRVTGQSCAEFLREELFRPLGMNDTALGAPDDWYDGKQPTIDRIAEIRLPDDMQDVDWNWNRRYWRSLGAPWGGLLTTPVDLARFAQLWLAGGVWDGRRLLSPGTVAAATRNQLSAMRDLPDVEQRTRPWGLGWRLNWPAHSANFGDLLGPRTYGHWGATGTVLWIDPDRDVFTILLTTQPQEPHGYYLARASNAIAACML